MTLRAVLPFESRCRSRLLFRLENGEQAALVVERGRTLRGGERVRIEDGREVEIVSAAESLLEAASAEPRLILKAAYHLGNRHVAVELMPDRLRFQADHVLAAMVRGLGLEVAAVIAPFEPEGGAYAHAHTHAADSMAPRGKIHSFSSP